MTKSSVLLADDNPAILEHVSKMLTDQFEVVGAVPDGETVLRDYVGLHPDVIVLDISMGRLSGIEVARRLRAGGCDSRIVFLTVHEGQDFVSAALDAGGSAYVVKSRLMDDLKQAITSALAGKVFVSASLNAEL